MKSIFRNWVVSADAGVACSLSLSLSLFAAAAVLVELKTHSFRIPF